MPGGIELLNQKESQRLEKRKILGNIGNGYYQSSRDERQNTKSSLDEKENFSKPNSVTEI